MVDRERNSIFISSPALIIAGLLVSVLLMSFYLGAPWKLLGYLSFENLIRDKVFALLVKLIAGAVIVSSCLYFFYTEEHDAE